MIVKALVYLQDHSDNDDALKLVPGSHWNSKLDANGDSNGHIQIRPELGDVLVFDQRITHQGQQDKARHAAARDRDPYSRILVSYGFGLNNVFTDNFEHGTVLRQNDQNEKLEPFLS